jgi:hypothetical protein
MLKWSTAQAGVCENEHFDFQALGFNRAYNKVRKKCAHVTLLQALYWEASFK